MKKNIVYYKSSTNMEEVLDNTIDLIITSPPYFNIKDYSKDGKQIMKHSKLLKNDMGNFNNYEIYLSELKKIWVECVRVLKPNGKLVINTPILPMKKSDISTHYNRDAFHLDNDIHSVIKKIDKIFFLDQYIWERSNSTKKLMFGSYPFPSNFYAQNTIEFITVYVKDGKPDNNIPKEIKKDSKLTKNEWLEYTKQIWRIPIPNKSDKAFGKHSAIMPEEIVKRIGKLYSFKTGIVLDPFLGSGTTAKVAKELERNYIGYELYKNYKKIIDEKLK